MSHAVSIDIEVTDLVALDAACKRVDLQLVQGQRQYTRWQARGKCDHAIVLQKPISGAYEIGVKATGKKTRSGEEIYALEYDPFHQQDRLEKYAGPRCNRLTMYYGVEVARRIAQRQNQSVYEKAEADGSVTLEIQVA